MDEVTLVVTACGRPDLLARTLRSFYAFCCYPLAGTIVIDDAFGHRGQVESIDAAYALVKTPHIFHLEDDWEFYRPGFIEASLRILKDFPSILQVWLREPEDTNGHPLEQRPEFPFRTLIHNFGDWNGFSWNPGLRRLEDYKRIAPYMKYWTTDSGYTEAAIGKVYRDLGYRAAIFPQGCVRHIGYGRSLPK
jgi:hypothetical protein